VEIITEMINNQNKESTMENVKIETLPEVIVASKRLIIPNYNALYEEAPAMGKIMKEHGAICQSPSYCFNIYHDEEYGETDIDIEICEAVTAFHENRDGLIYKTINRVETAATIKHHGNYDSLAESYAIILKWIENNNYRITDKLRESFIDGIWNKVDPKDWLTVIQIPIEQM
jgi:effector-binding domain-containing protein